MAKPATLQLLNHGKLICKAVFPFFVETFNWVVTAFDNLRGDFDVNPKNGAITIDRTNHDHPVIRLRTDNLNLGGGKEYVPGEDTNITFTEQSDGTVAVNVYYL